MILGFSLILITDNDLKCLRSFVLFQSQEGLEPSRQRWFFGGKLLGDKMHIEEAKIQQSYVIQVIVNPDKIDTSPTKAS